MKRGRATPQQRAIAIAAKINKMYPYSTYGRAYLQRGTAGNLTRFGPTWKEASEEQRANRKKVGYLGRGLYRGRGGFFGRALGNLFGMGDLGDKLGDAAWSVGKNFLPPQAGMVGDAVFNVTDKMTGKGLYRGRGSYVTNNLIQDAAANNVVPQFHPSDMHEVIYSNREFVRDILAPAAGVLFQIDTLPINPGLAQTFPWLSQVAINFEEYEIMQLAFTYKSTVADFASATGQVGQVLIATQYNPSSDSFSDKQEMMLYEGGMSCKTTETMIHGVECDPAKLTGDAQKYVRAGNVPATEDLKQYDIGKTSIAVLNVPAGYATQQIGELWVSYTVKLRKPKEGSGHAYNTGRAIFVSKDQSGPRVLGAPLSSVLGIGVRNTLPVQWVAAPSTTTLVPSGAGTDWLTQVNPSPFTLTRNAAGYFVLPSYFSGILRFRVILGYPGATAIPAITHVVAQGNIYRFADIPAQPTNVPVQAWTHCLETIRDRDGSDTMTLADGEYHLRILPASNGVENRIWIAPGDNNTFTSRFVLVEFTQYNSFLSVQDNGSADRMDLITPSGQTYTYA